MVVVEYVVSILYFILFSYCLFVSIFVVVSSVKKAEARNLEKHRMNTHNLENNNHESVPERTRGKKASRGRPICAICDEYEPAYMFECGHRVVCENCGDGQYGSKCPICMRTVHRMSVPWYEGMGPCGAEIME